MLENRASLTNDSLQLTAYGLQSTDADSSLTAHPVIQNPESKISSHLLTFSPSHHSWRLLLANCFLILVMMLGMGDAWGQEEIETGKVYTSSGNYQAPTGYYISKIECWGGGGNGWKSNNSQLGGTGGGGGGYVATNVSNIPSTSSVTVSVGSNASTTVTLNSNYWVKADKGADGSSSGGGTGGSYSVKGWTVGSNDHHKGGDGGDGAQFHKYDTYWSLSCFCTKTRCDEWIAFSGGGGQGAGSNRDGADGDDAWHTGSSAIKCAAIGGNGDGGSSILVNNPGDNKGEGLGGTDHSNGAGSGKVYGGGGGGSVLGTAGSGASGCVQFTLTVCEVTITFHDAPEGFSASSSASWPNGWNSNHTITRNYNQSYSNTKVDDNYAPTRLGYTFAGWYTKKRGESYHFI